MLLIMYNFYMLYISFIYMYVTCICMYSVHVWCCHLATWNMPFSLVLQKLSSFRLAVKFSIFDMQQKNHRSISLLYMYRKVLLVNLLAALNFANVFFQNNAKNMTKINKKCKKRFYIYD